MGLPTLEFHGDAWDASPYAIIVRANEYFELTLSGGDESR
jgi:hypothetical protein